jgi:hypothetical protein
MVKKSGESFHGPGLEDVDAGGDGNSHFGVAAGIAGAEFPQQPPRINAKVVVIVPLESDRVLTDAFYGDRFGRGFEHGQSAGSELWRFAGLAPGFFTLLVTHGAWARVTQVDEGVVRSVAIAPYDVNAGARGEVYFD